LSAISLLAKIESSKAEHVEQTLCGITGGNKRHQPLSSASAVEVNQLVMAILTGLISSNSCDLKYTTRAGQNLRKVKECPVWLKPVKMGH